MAEAITEVELTSVRDDDLLGDFAAPLGDLLGSGRALSTSFKAAAKALNGAPENGVIQFTIRDGRKRESWCLGLTPGGCHASEGRTDHPNLEILTDTETWTALARGEVSPLAAFVSGKVRVIGSIDLARSMVRRLR